MSQVAAFGRVAKIQDVPTQGVTRIVLELPIECFQRAVALFHAMEVLLTLAPPDIGKEHPYGILGDEQIAPPAAGTGAAGDDRAAPRGVVAKTADPSAVGPKCRVTVQWCADPAFQEWFSRAFPAQVQAAAAQIPARRKGFVEARTTHALKALLGIVSRREIDDNPVVSDNWNELVRIPWIAHQSNGDPF